MSSSYFDILLNDHNLAILVTILALCCFITVLLVVLFIMCVRYRRRALVSRSAIKTISKSEASKLYVVESSTERVEETVVSPSNVTSPLPLLSSSSCPTQVTISISPLPHDIVLNMESNPLYHQLRTDSNDGERADSSPGSSSTESSRHQSYQSTTDTPSQPQPVPVIITTTVTNTDQTDNVSHSQSYEVLHKCHSVPQEASNNNYENSEGFPPPPIFNSHSNSCMEDNFVRTLSDTHLAVSRSDCDNTYGPLYNSVQFHSTKALSILEIQPSNITTMGTLGMGQFGQVHLAHTHNLSATELGLGDSFDRSETYEVAVKFLNENATQSDTKAFQKEIKNMSQLRHKNVVQILAVCWEEKNFVVLEYMRNGDLESFLQHYMTVNMGRETYDTTISYHQLVSMSLQIADAMRFLSSKNFIHRDLACRNCLVGENFLVKVADFGLSKNLYDSCYYRFKGSALLPIRWMAPESFFGRFSEKTDVWSFGVTMWEIFNLCKEKPYHRLSDQDIVQAALKQTLPCLDKPECCTLEVYEIMKTCLRTRSTNRADFESVYSQLLTLDNIWCSS